MGNDKTRRAYGARSSAKGRLYVSVAVAGRSANKEVLVLRFSRRESLRMMIGVIGGGGQPVVVDHVQGRDIQRRTRIDNEPQAVATCRGEDHQVVSRQVGGRYRPIQKDLVGTDPALQIIEVREEKQAVVMVLPVAAGDGDLVRPVRCQVRGVRCRGAISF